MTREQINTIFIDLGIEAPQKGVVNALLNAFNQEKAQEIDNIKKSATDEAEAKYKGYIKPEDHQKIVDELNAEKGKGALAERKAKYQKANLNIDDEDILAIVESKLKDSKKFDEELADYVKAHPSFVKQIVKEEPKAEEKPQQTKVITIGGASSDKNNGQNNSLDLNGAINDYYSDKK